MSLWCFKHILSKVHSVFCCLKYHQFPRFVQTFSHKNKYAKAKTWCCVCKITICYIRVNTYMHIEMNGIPESPRWDTPPSVVLYAGIRLFLSHGLAQISSTCKNASDTVNKIPHRFLKDSKTETAFVGYSCKSGMNREWMAPKNRRKFIPYLKLMTIFPLTCTTETILEGEKMF